MSIIESPEKLKLGESLPPNDPHGVSVHLPTWADTVGWASREARVLDAMVTGYPRFFIPRVVDRLAARILDMQRLDSATEAVPEKTTEARLAVLVLCRRHAELCRRFLLSQESNSASNPPKIEVLRVTWDGQISVLKHPLDPLKRVHAPCGKEPIYAVSYPAADLFPAAKAFWQHTGFGISSRRATYWFDNAPFLASQQNGLTNGANLTSVDETKEKIRRRIATWVASDEPIQEENVYLYPAGMAAIAEIASAIQSLRPNKETPFTVAVIGFLYVDTIKVLTRILGFEATVYKYGDSEIDDLETKLKSGLQLDALFTEFPGNPLLQSPNLLRLQELSQEYSFFLVVDDTIGTCANVSVLPQCDVVCTSLTKMFSGGCNVMGGAAILSPKSPHREGLQTRLLKQHDDHIWFPQDMAIMEENSRDFPDRVHHASRNAQMIVGWLRDHPTVDQVYYPFQSPTQATYDRFRLPGGLYGFLVSIKFTSPARAVAFYDALDVAKGPSLGTNFTLCCAYTLLAHHKELDWAAEYGVVEDLVRISVGLEDEEWLKKRVDKALKAASDCPES